MKFSLKVAFMLTAIIVMMATTLTGSVTAGSTGKQLSTNYTLVNFGTSDATVIASYMKSDGSAWAADSAATSFTIPANYGISVIRQYFDTTMTAGQGSVVISSSQSLGAVVQIQARNQIATQGAYSGYSEGSNKFYVPLAARNKGTASGKANSQIIIQNVDTFAFTATVDLYAGATKTYTKTTVSLAPGQSFYYDLADEAATNVPDNWIGSAVVTGGSNGKVAVVSNFFTGNDAMQTFNAFASTSIGPKWVVPLFFSRLVNGLSSVIAVQNLSGANIPANSVTLSCQGTKVDAANTPFTLTVKNPADIADNASYSFNPVTDTALFPDAVLKGSCVLDAGTANVVAIVQLRYVGGTGNPNNAAAYEAISASATAGKTLVFPLVAKRLANGFASTVAIQNMDLSASGQAASVTLTYTPSFNTAECPLATCDINKDGKLDASDKITVGPLTIPAGGSIQRNHRITSGQDFEEKLPEQWQGSLVVKSTTSNINGFAQLTYFTNKDGDTFMAHNAFVQP